MGVWQGIAQFVQEDNQRRNRQKEIDSQNKIRRQELEENRAIRKEELAQSRSHDIQLIEKKFKQQQDLILEQLRISKAARDASASSLKADVTKVGKMIEGVEGSEEYLNGLINNPQFAPVIISKIEELQKEKGRALTPKEILGITPIITDEGIGVVVSAPEDFDERETLLFEEEVAKNRSKNKAKPQVSVESDLYNEWSKEEIDRAEDVVNNKILDYINEEISSLKGSADPAATRRRGELQQIRTGILEGDKPTISQAAREYGDIAVAEAILNDLERNPDLRAISKSPTFGSNYFNILDAPDSINTEEEAEVSVDSQIAREVYSREEILGVYNKLPEGQVKDDFRERFKDILNERVKPTKPRNRRDNGDFFTNRNSG